MNFYLLHYALSYIFRYKTKNIFVVSVLGFLTALLASVFFIANSLSYELTLTQKSLADIVVQNTQGGMHHPIKTSVADSFYEINGVQEVESRVWGYYYFSPAKVHFMILGLDSFEPSFLSSLQQQIQKHESKKGMLVSARVQEILHKYYYDKEFHFIRPDGSMKNLTIDASLPKTLRFESQDMMLMNQADAREILGLASDEVSSVFLKVSNPKEIDNIVMKIHLQYPQFMVLSKKDLYASYQNIFNYKGGLFLVMMLVSFLTFFMIVYDKASGLSSAEKQEVGVLKALGWRVEDVLKTKLYEGLITSLFAYIFGVLLALVYVYNFDAPLLKYIFLDDTPLTKGMEFVFVVDYATLFLVFLLSVPLYVAATIIPSWKIATMDAYEVMR